MKLFERQLQPPLGYRRAMRAVTLHRWLAMPLKERIITGMLHSFFSSSARSCHTLYCAFIVEDHLLKFLWNSTIVSCIDMRHLQFGN